MFNDRNDLVLVAGSLEIDALGDVGSWNTQGGSSHYDDNDDDDTSNPSRKSSLTFFNLFSFKTEYSLTRQACNFCRVLICSRLLLVIGFWPFRSGLDTGVDASIVCDDSMS